MIHACSERMMIIWSFCLIFSLSNSILVIASPGSHLCLPDQRDALLEFKNEFNVQKPDWWMPYNTTTETWRNNTDCCSWDGISCDPMTGKVVDLDLSDSYLNGPLRSNSSLFRLQHLQSLDLSSNDLTGILPESIGNLKYLRILSLSFCNLFGKIPSSFGNLSYLIHLDLIFNDLSGEVPDSMGNLNQLNELFLGENNLNGSFPLMLLNLSNLTNMSSLSSKLEYLSMDGNLFSGSIPSSLFMIPSLIYLNLVRNHFSGSLEIGNISSPSKLETLYLGENNINGPISRSISKLVSLMFLDLSFLNLGRGMIDLGLFSHLISLGELDLSHNNLKISSTLHLPSTIETLKLSSCSITEFPKFLKALNNLSYLDISSNQIEGQIPEWLWMVTKLQRVNISQNSFSGFEGPTDIIQRSDLQELDISLNTFHDFPLLPKSTIYFYGSENRFSGEIPKTICELIYLQILVLSNNNFSGSIPLCFENFRTTLSVLHLRNNSLSGIFPEESINDRLISVDVGLNRLSGELPKSLINCTRLRFLNVEDNLFNDKFPFWLGLFQRLQVLVLRSNEFHGPISISGVSLSFPLLRIFDISENRFTGVLPSDYFAGWTALSSVVDIVDNTTDEQLLPEDNLKLYHKSVDLRIKGLMMQLIGSSYTVYKTIDVSGNRLEGDIPKSIGLLKELFGLNMSNNAFTSRIPTSLANLTNLESLDLSQNQLSGEIPPELGKLAFLARMNFSYNMLEGPIPKGPQVQSQDSSSFSENPGLCGVPLEKLCGEDKEETKQEEDEDEEKEEEVLNRTTAAIGYVPGVLCGLAIGHILNSCKHDWFLRIFHSST